MGGDNLSKSIRSKIMRSIPAEDTKPEALIRSKLHDRKYRFNKNVKSLPGKPDIVFPGPRWEKAAIQVHGCFWHGHDCSYFVWPKSNIDFWKKKIRGNQERDQKTEQKLVDNGWRVLVVWECSIRDKPENVIEKLIDQIVNWIETGPKGRTVIGGDNLAK